MPFVLSGPHCFSRFEHGSYLYMLLQGSRIHSAEFGYEAMDSGHLQSTRAKNRSCLWTLASFSSDQLQNPWISSSFKKLEKPYSSPVHQWRFINIGAWREKFITGHILHANDNLAGSSGILLDPRPAYIGCFRHCVLLIMVSLPFPGTFYSYSFTWSIIQLDIELWLSKHARLSKLAVSGGAEPDGS